MMSSKPIVTTLLTPLFLFILLLGTQVGILVSAQQPPEDHPSPAHFRQELLRLERLLAEADKAFLGYVVVRQPRFLEPLVATEHKIRERLDALTESAGPSTDLQGRVQVLASRVNEFLGAIRQLAQNLDEGQEEGVLLYLRTGEGVARANTIALVVQDLERRIEQRERMREADRATSKVWARVGLVATTVGTLAVGIGYGRMRVQPTDRLKDIARSPHLST